MNEKHTGIKKYRKRKERKKTRIIKREKGKEKWEESKWRSKITEKKVARVGKERKRKRMEEVHETEGTETGNV